MSLMAQLRKSRYVLIILGLVVLYAVFNKSINYEVGLLYLRVTNNELININNLSIEVPYKYVRKVQPSDVTFTDFPDGQGKIIVRSEFVYDFDKYVDNYLRHIKSINYEVIETGKLTIGGAQGFLIRSGSSLHRDIEEVTVLIPEKRVMVNYKGNHHKWHDYFTIIQSIKFTN